jgi:hypothetical protein
MTIAELASWSGEGDHPHFAEMKEAIAICDKPESNLRQCATGRSIYYTGFGSRMALGIAKSMLIRHLIDFHGAVEFGGKGADMRGGMARYADTKAIRADTARAVLTPRGGVVLTPGRADTNSC